MNRILWAILISCCFSAVAYANPLERRRDQFQNTPGLLVFPVPYSFPGIGQGLFLIASANNLLETSTDVSLIGFTGDAEGYIMRLNEFFLVPGFAYVSLTQGRIAKFGQNVYSSRGMDNEKEDYNIFVGEDSKFSDYKGVITLFDRRLELTYGVNVFDGKIVEIRDFEGELIQELDDPITFKDARTFYQAKFDFTDDYDDPRSGINLRIRQDNNPGEDDGDPEFTTLSYALTLYVPLLEQSTWGFHYFRSNADVTKTGNTDLESLKEENSFSNCDGEEECENAVTATSQNQLNANQNGSSQPLGGTNLLRAYPQGRYQAAHTQMYGTEFRWNFNTAAGKLDLFFLQDTVSSFQLAFFFEQGSVVEKESDLGSIVRNSYGVGFRLVGKSGAVYRFDFASGDEGNTVIAFFEYPWGDSFGS